MLSSRLGLGMKSSIYDDQLERGFQGQQDSRSNVYSTEDQPNQQEEDNSSVSLHYCNWLGVIDLSLGLTLDRLARLPRGLLVGLVE